MRCELALLSLAPAMLAAQPVTFTKDIAPIVFKYCAACHRPGEAAPFSLLTYDETKKHARQIAAVTKSRFMPPWPPEPGKGDFLGARRLTQAQIEVIQRWSRSGAPEGAAADLPPQPRFVEGWQLGQPDLIVTLGRPYTLAASGSDVFRNFVLRVPLSTRRYVKALEVRPGNKRIVHHANVLVDRTASARSRDGIDGAPGFAGMDVNLETQGFEPDTHFLFWKPGTVYSEEPAGMSWELAPGADLVLNMHLQPSGKPEVLQPSIGLYFTDAPPLEHPMLVQLEHDGALDIPAGESGFVVRDHLTLPVDVDVLAVYPHAHYIGKDLQAIATLPGGTKRWLIRIPDWDINWQAVYRYRTPIRLPEGTVISMRYTYDNSAANPRNPNHPPQRVVSGDRSTDEMAHLWLQLLPHSDGSTLQEAVMRRRLEKYPEDFLAQYTLAAMSESRGEHATAIDLFRKALAVQPGNASACNALGTSLVAAGKVLEALPEFQAAIRSRPDYAFAHYNLARSMLMLGRPAEAIPHLRKVVASDPADAPALSNLGVALHMTGKIEEGFDYLRRAVRSRPDYFDGRYNLGQALAAQGNADAAAEELRAAIALQGNDADAHAALGMVLAEKRDLKGAEKELTEALRLNPANPEIQQNLAAVRQVLK